MSLTIDIHSKAPWPADCLSNFAPHRFSFRNVSCGSMEGLLQALKIQDPAKQIEVCALAGISAKHAGVQYGNDWKDTQTLWWQGQPIPRHGAEYKELLTEAYSCLFADSPHFRNALRNTGTANIVHTIGVSDPTQTVLTEAEFCQILLTLRGKFSLVNKIIPKLPAP